MTTCLGMSGPLGPSCTLGEGPRWDEQGQRLLWVDIDEGLLLSAELTQGSVGPVSTRAIAPTVGAAAPAGDGGVLVAAHDRLMRLRPDGSASSSRPLLTPGRRFNDGAVDPFGRFVVGTLSLGQHSWGEQLLRIEFDGRVTVLDGDLGLSNGLAWSADGSVFYSVDTERRTVFVREYDVTGVGVRRTWIEIEDGFPDGIAVDVDDHVWVAVWGAGELRRFSPAGVQVDVICVPAPHTSALAFAGNDADILVVTTARKDLGPLWLREFPGSGHLFVGSAPVPGLRPTPWAVGPLPL